MHWVCIANYQSVKSNGTILRYDARMISEQVTNVFDGYFIDCSVTDLISIYGWI